MLLLIIATIVHAHQTQETPEALNTTTSHIYIHRYSLLLSVWLCVCEWGCIQVH